MTFDQYQALIIAEETATDAYYNAETAATVAFGQVRRSLLPEDHAKAVQRYREAVANREALAVVRKEAVANREAGYRLYCESCRTHEEIVGIMKDMGF